jgi:phenylacetate-CoA ligase
MRVVNALSRNVFYPLWDMRDRSRKLKVLGELCKTQWLPVDDLQDRQWTNLRETLTYVYSHCPHYRATFDEAGIRPESVTEPEHVRQIPLLSKDDVREHQQSLISDQFHVDDLIPAKTGGSTGKALSLYFNKSCQEVRNAAALRSLIWAGWRLGETRAMLWGNPPVADTLKKKIRNALLDRLIYLDTMNVNEQTMGEFVSLCRKRNPTLYFGHSRSHYMFARFLLAEGITDLRPNGVVSTSMMLLPHERSAITEAFQCEVIDQYGCEEVGLIACECEQHEGLHVNIDHLYVEFVREDGTAAKPGDEAKIVVTDLVNRGMPLVRYVMEDMVVPASRECSCGRGLPLIKTVTGRTADFLVRTDGSLVAGVSLVERTLTRIKGIGQMQIVQERIDRIVLRVVRDHGYDDASERELQGEFREVFGSEVQIDIEHLERLPQTSSGKYRFAESKVDIAARQ